jgi:hypothetical protein
MGCCAVGAKEPARVVRGQFRFVQVILGNRDVFLAHLRAAPTRKAHVRFFAVGTGVDDFSAAAWPVMARWPKCGRMLGPHRLCPGQNPSCHSEICFGNRSNPYREKPSVRKAVYITLPIETKFSHVLLLAQGSKHE